MIVNGTHYLGEGHCKNCTEIFNSKSKNMKKITIELTEEQLEKIKESGILEEKKEFLSEGQKYWVLTSAGIDSYSFENDHSFDKKLIDRGNVYLTEEGALKADEKRCALGKIQKFIREEGLEFEPDWKNCLERKYQIEGWDYASEEVFFDWYYSCDYSQYNMIFRTEEELKEVLNNCSEELRVLLRK